jgi:hypothetical protein
MGLRFNNSTFLHGLAGSEPMHMRTGYAAHAKSCAVRNDRGTPLEFWHGSCPQHVCVRSDELSLCLPTYICFVLFSFCVFLPLILWAGGWWGTLLFAISYGGSLFEANKYRMLQKELYNFGSLCTFIQRHVQCFELP